MSKKAIVDFTYKDNTYEVECNRDDKMKDICEVFVKTAGIDIEKVDFQYLKDALNTDLTFEECYNLKKEKGAYAKFVGNVSKGLDIGANQ